jgi:murein DD-endopeptidase MepM/ murein hydrolase activator NlpD
MLTPVSGILSSHFGERIDPFSGSPKFHEGVDIEAVKGAGIKAVLDGTVEEAGSSPSYGNYIKLSHAGGLETIYAHCSSLNVKKGLMVKQGEVIAKVGDSGASVGVHLHFEVLKDGKPVDPLDYIVLAASENQD